MRGGGGGGAKHEPLQVSEIQIVCEEKGKEILQV